MIDYLIESKQQIVDLEAKLAGHNEYFKSFSCKDFNEFQDFISTFMLTPHEEQSLIQELKQQLAEKEFEHSRDLDRLNEELKSYKYAVGQMWELLNDKDKGEI